LDVRLGSIVIKYYFELDGGQFFSNSGSPGRTSFVSLRARSLLLAGIKGTFVQSVPDAYALIIGRLKIENLEGQAIVIKYFFLACLLRS